MANHFMNDANHWRERAKEARVHAEQIDDPESKKMMLRIAEDSSLCRRMKAICASVNFDLFMVLPRPTARIAHAAKLEFSSNDRSEDREAGHARADRAEAGLGKLRRELVLSLRLQAEHELPIR